MAVARLEVHLPVFNEEAHLPRLLGCLERQTFKDFRVIIHDNGSTDATPEICRKAAQADPRIRIHRYPMNSGPMAQGYRIRFACHAEYVAIRSANDLIADQYLEKTLDLLERDKTIGLAYSHGVLIDDNGETVALPDESDRIDTRGASGATERAIMVMRRYGYSFALWGVYRRDIFELTREPKFSYGNDHVQVCEMALYGNVVSTEDRLDFRRITANEVRFYPEGVRSWARQYSEEYARGVPADSPYSSIAVHLPFTNMIWGHIEMLSLAKVDESVKSVSAEAAIEIFCSRFGNYLQHETAQFLSAVRTELPLFRQKLVELPRHLRAMRLGKLRVELNKLSVVPFVAPADIAALDRELAEISGGGTERG